VAGRGPLAPLAMLFGRSPSGRVRMPGRRPRDTRYQGAAGDIESPPRLIEVKAFGGSNRGFGLWLEVRQFEAAQRNPNFCVYVVENVRQGDPARFSLKVLGGERLRRLLQRAKERRYFEVPWPVADYDSSPGEVWAPGPAVVTTTSA
jgi:hypothetical protein